MKSTPPKTAQRRALYDFVKPVFLQRRVRVFSGRRGVVIFVGLSTLLIDLSCETDSVEMDEGGIYSAYAPSLIPLNPYNACWTACYAR